MYYQARVRTHDKPFPVSDDFFPQPLLLSEERLASLRAEAARALEDTLAECQVYQRTRGTYLINSPPWRARCEVEGLSEYKRTHRSQQNTSESRVFGTVPGNYHDLAQFFHSDTREAFFNVQKKLFRYTIDAAVLHNVAPDPEASPLAYEGIKWAAYEPFSLRFRMDSCHFESSGTGVDAQGKPYAYRIVLPTAFPEVPDLFKTKRTVRMACTVVMLFMPSGRSSDASELFVTMHNDFKTNSVPRSLFKRFLLNLHKVHTHLKSTRGGGYVWSPRANEWTQEKDSSTQRGECGVCSRAFPRLRTKRSCYVCGELVCAKCLVRSSDVLQVKPLAAASSRMCLPCIQLLREDREHALTTPNHAGGEQDIWEKSPTIHEPLRMSETPTETSYGETHASFISGTRFSVASDIRSSQPDWTTTPTSATRRSTLHRPSIASSASDRTSMVSLTSPISVVGGPNEEIEYIDDEDVIYEEDPELLSQRSDIGTGRGGVLYTVDTSDMERVRGESLGAFSTGSARSTHSFSATRSASVSSERVFQSISSSLHEQELLLRQLQAATIRARRDTRSSSSSTELSAH